MNREKGGRGRGKEEDSERRASEMEAVATPTGSSRKIKALKAE